MPRHCSVCSSNEATRAVIAAALVAGETLAELSRRVGISEHALRRHRAHAKAAPANAQDLAATLDLWLARLDGLYRNAEKDGQLRTMVDVSKAVMSLIERKHELEAEKIAREAAERSTSATPLESMDAIVKLGRKIIAGQAEYQNLDFSRQCPACLRPGYAEPVTPN